MDLGELSAIAFAPVQRMKREAMLLDPATPESCNLFYRHVVTVEAVLKQQWEIFAALSRKAETLECLADIWSTLAGYCEDLIGVLNQFKDQYPKCGTPALYDLTQSYLEEARERERLTMGATANKEPNALAILRDSFSEDDQDALLIEEMKNDESEPMEAVFQRLGI